MVSMKSTNIWKMRLSKRPVFGYKYDKFQGKVYELGGVLELLEEVRELIDAGEIGYRQARDWIKLKTGLKISHEGLRLRLRQPTYYYKDKDVESSTTDTRAEEAVQQGEA